MVESEVVDESEVIDESEVMCTEKDPSGDCDGHIKEKSKNKSKTMLSFFKSSVNANLPSTAKSKPKRVQVNEHFFYI